MVPLAREQQTRHRRRAANDGQRGVPLFFGGGLSRPFSGPLEPGPPRRPGRRFFRSRPPALRPSPWPRKGKRRLPGSTGTERVVRFVLWQATQWAPSSISGASRDSLRTGANPNGIEHSSDTEQRRGRRFSRLGRRDVPRRAHPEPRRSPPGAGTIAERARAGLLSDCVPKGGPLLWLGVRPLVRARSFLAKSREPRRTGDGAFRSGF
jgi:hypothetical protein